MVQTLYSITVLAGEKKKLFERPHHLHRIFFSIRVFADPAAWYETKISFDDPKFLSFYVLNGPAKYFEARGDDIFQGDIWVYNLSDINLLYTTTEILH